jgi:hypothetical protein
LTFLLKIYCSSEPKVLADIKRQELHWNSELCFNKMELLKICFFLSLKVWWHECNIWTLQYNVHHIYLLYFINLYFMENILPILYTRFCIKFSTKLHWKWTKF